jgi:hypothetical protein
MKRSVKKPLALSRETLRSLRSDDLVDAEGGAVMQSKVNMNCSNGALNCTYACQIAWSIGACF